MSNARAAYYTYLAMRDRDTARVFRNFGYFASADHVERRAARYEAMAKHESKEPPPVCDGGSCASLFHTDPHDDLHTTSDS